MITEQYQKMRGDAARVLFDKLNPEMQDIVKMESALEDIQFYAFPRQIVPSGPCGGGGMGQKSTCFVFELWGDAVLFHGTKGRYIKDIDILKEMRK